MAADPSNSRRIFLALPCPAAVICAELATAATDAPVGVALTTVGAVAAGAIVAFNTGAELGKDGCKDEIMTMSKRWERIPY